VSQKKLILVVIDGLTPSMLETALAAGALPTIGALAGRGRLGRAVTVFPSLTPVCLTSIATGAYPDVHHIPHLVWYHRGEERVVEYGSSFPRRSGPPRDRDTIFGMSGDTFARRHCLGLEDADLEPAAINHHTRAHAAPGPAAEPLRRNRWYEAVYGPTHFFYFNLFESSDGRAAGDPPRSRGRRVRGRGRALARHLRRLRPSSSARLRPPRTSPLDGALDALERTDGALGGSRAAGGPRPFERYAVVVTRPARPRRARRQPAGCLPGDLAGVLPLAGPA
jgi:hypothetical protein